MGQRNGVQENGLHPNQRRIEQWLMDFTPSLKYGNDVAFPVSIPYRNCPTTSYTLPYLVSGMMLMPRP